VVPYLDQVNVVKRFKADTKGNFYTNNLLLNVVSMVAHPSNWKLLTRGAGAQLLLSVPHGALNFAVLEFIH
jgi:hypothetical protein